jgi:hypothetical protein
MVIGAVLTAAVMIVRLRVEGLDVRSILVKALRQPSWWRSWYPRPLRQPGDVWDRLPPMMRRFRIAKGLLLAFVWAVAMPLTLTTTWLHRTGALQPLLLAASLGGIVSMLALRRRALQEMRERAGGPLPNALSLLNTPTSRVSTWLRPPTGSLLVDQTSSPPTGSSARA